MLTTTTTSKLQLPIQQEEESSGESETQCFMIQGNDSLEVQSDTQLDASSNSYCNECLEAQAMNDELAKKL